MRRLKTIPSPPGNNSMRDWHRRVNPLRVSFQFVVIVICRYLPSLKLKNFLYRMIGIKLAKNVSMGLMAMVDIFFPQKIYIGENSVIGYNTTILTHEFLVEEFRVGEVVIGSDVMIGANTTILPGIHIGDGARIGAGSVVTKDIPGGSTACGIPARVLEQSRPEEVLH